MPLSWYPTLEFKFVLTFRLGQGTKRPASQGKPLENGPSGKSTGSPLFSSLASCFAFPAFSLYCHTLGTQYTFLLAKVISYSGSPTAPLFFIFFGTDVLMVFTSTYQ